MNKATNRGIAATFLGLLLSWPAVAAAQTVDYDLLLYVTMAQEQVALDSGYTKRHVDSVIYINPVYDSIYHVNAVDTVSYLIPDAALRIGIWGQPSPKGIEKPNFDNDFILRFSTQEERDSAYAALSQCEEVLSVEKAAAIPLFQVPPHDSLFGDQWGLFNDGQAGGTPGMDIGATLAWEITTGDPSLIVAVIDVGVEGQHPDFQAVAGPRVFGDNTQTGWHGTGVAGIIGAAANNGGSVKRGIAGVDWQAQILAKNAGAGPSSIDLSLAVEKIIAAVDEGASVMNLSWGGPGGETPLAKAFAYAYNNDIVMVASMGNDGAEVVNYPAALARTIAVGSIRNNGVRSPSSTYGNHIDLVAPGAWVGEVDPEAMIRTLTTSAGYTWTWGTSFAAPHVAGSAALLRGFMPSLSNDDVENVLKLSARDRGAGGFDILYGHGLLKVDSALRLLQLPNTVRQWQIGTPTVYDVSDYAVRQFYAPGMESISYLAKKYELRADVTFPKIYHNFVAAWGRGSMSNGWSFANPNYGLGFCSFVPGTLTPQGGTLETVVYEIRELPFGEYVGFRPCLPSEAIMAYSVLGEELLVTPVLNVTVKPAEQGEPGGNRIDLSWVDTLVNETAWHIDRRVLGGWEIDYAVLPANSISFEDTDIVYGSQEYTYRMRTVNDHQTPAYSNEVTVRSRPNWPSCVSAYVVQVNLLDPLFDPSLCPGNEGECGGPGGPEGPMGPMGPMGEGSIMQSQEAGASCVASDMIVVEWQLPENQMGDIAGYRVLRMYPPEYSYYPQTTAFVDTICDPSPDNFTLSVVTVDVYGEKSDPLLPYEFLTTGSFNYCNWGYPDKRVADLSDERAGRDWEFAIRDNRPNPFNAGTILAFTLPRSESWNLTIHDILGRVVRRFDGRGGPGPVEIPFDARTTAGEELATGVYFWRLHTPTASGVRKMMIVK